MTETCSSRAVEVREGTGAPDATGVLMAGGRSRRMGQDKAGLSWRGEFLWQRQLRVLRQAGVGRLMVSGRRDGPWARNPGDFSVVEDAVLDRGPLAGLMSAFNAMTGDWLVVLAVDLPRMEPAYLEQLLACARSTGRGCVPISGGQYEPLAAVYPRAVGLMARECLEHDRLSLQHWVKAANEAGFVTAREVLPHERDLFFNLNTPADRISAGTVSA